MRELNTREFRIITRAFRDADDLSERGYDRDALYALREPKKILERYAVKTRMLAIVYMREGRLLSKLGRTAQAAAAFEKAIGVLEAIHDTSGLKEQCLSRTDAPGPADHPAKKSAAEKI